MTPQKKYNFVYLTINQINGRGYIGDHSTDNLKDGYLGSGRPLFENAKLKYGKENFKREILEFFGTKEEAFNAQEKYIKLLKTHISQGGYNLNWKGGKGPLTQEMRDKIGNFHKGKKLSKETKEKISKSRKGKVPWNKGIKGVIKYSDDINMKKGRKGKSNGFHGKKHSEESLLKMSDNKKENKNPMYGKQGTMLGKKHSPETIEKMRISHTKKFFN